MSTNNLKNNVFSIAVLAGDDDDFEPFGELPVMTVADDLDPLMAAIGNDNLVTPAAPVDDAEALFDVAIEGSEAELVATAAAAAQDNETRKRLADAGLTVIDVPEEVSAPTTPAPVSKPKITINAKLYTATAIINQAERAMIAYFCGLKGIYERGDALVKLKKSRDEIKIKPLTKYTVAECFGVAAEWYKIDSKGKEIKCFVPQALAETYFNRPDWQVPHLKYLISSPTMREDGSVITVPGYDASTEIFVDFDQNDYDPNLAEILSNPARSDALVALEKLKDHIKTFPFVSPADLSVAMAMILTGVVRPAFDVVPMFAVSATAAGTGKTTLVDVAGLIATGHRIKGFAQGKNDEEFEKRFVSKMLAGDLIVNIDNIERPLGGDFICQVVTQPVTQARPLGHSKMVEINSGMICATGNALTVKGDMNRRTLICSLDAKVEDPEKRVFPGDVLAETLQKRAELVMAVLIILRAFVVAGKPQQSTPLGSFGDWSKLVRDALLWLGEADPVETMEKAKADDPERSQLAAVLNLWRASKALLQDDYYTVDELIKIVNDPNDGDPTLASGLLPVGGVGNVLNAPRLGRWLGRIKGRIVDGLKVEGRKNRTKTMEWCVVKAVDVAAPVGAAGGGDAADT